MEYSVSLLFSVIWIFVGVIISVVVWQLKRIAILVDKPLLASSVVVTVCLVMYVNRAILESNDFYGWGICVVPAAIGGCLIVNSFVQKNGFVVVFSLIVIEQIIGTIEMSSYTGIMDNLGYAINYWQSQIQRYPEIVLARFEDEINATLIYLAITCLIQFGLYLLLKFLTHFKRLESPTIKRAFHNR